MGGWRVHDVRCEAGRWQERRRDAEEEQARQGARAGSSGGRLTAGVRVQLHGCAAHLRCGRPDRSSTTWTKASSRGAAPGGEGAGGAGQASLGARRKGWRHAGADSSRSRHPAQPASQPATHPYRPTSNTARRHTHTHVPARPPVKSPKRWMPLRSPSACASAPPSASAMSSLVWWSSIQVSPSASTVTSNRPWEASWSIMWSRKGIWRWVGGWERWEGGGRTGRVARTEAQGAGRQRGGRWRTA